MKDRNLNFDLCTDCGTRIPATTAARPFHHVRLCPSCVDDLFLTSRPFQQVAHQ